MTKLLFILLLLFSINILLAEKVSLSVGISETMGIHGIINANYEILYNKQINKRNHYFLTAGPFGAGFSFKKYYWESAKGKNHIVSQTKAPKVVGFLSFTTFYGRFFLPLLSGVPYLEDPYYGKHSNGL